MGSVVWTYTWTSESHPDDRQGQALSYISNVRGHLRTVALEIGQIASVQSRVFALGKAVLTKRPMHDIAVQVLNDLATPM